MSVYFVGDYDVHKNHLLTFIISLTKKKSNPPILFISNTFFYIIVPSGSSCSGFSKQTLHSLLLYYMHAIFHKCIIFLVTIMLIISGEE